MVIAQLISCTKNGFNNDIDEKTISNDYGVQVQEDVLQDMRYLLCMNIMIHVLMDITVVCAEHLI